MYPLRTNGYPRSHSHICPPFSHLTPHYGLEHSQSVLIQGFRSQRWRLSIAFDLLPIPISQKKSHEKKQNIAHTQDKGAFFEWGDHQNQWFQY